MKKGEIKRPTNEALTFYQILYRWVKYSADDEWVIAV
jgi:hypothetical protein